MEEIPAWVYWSITTGISLIVGILGTLVGRSWQRHDNKVAKDKETLSKLIQILPSDGIIFYIRTRDFGLPFSHNVFISMDDFMDNCSRPEFFFIDKKLELLRKQLLKCIDDFDSRLAQESFVHVQLENSNSIKPAHEYSDFQEYKSICDELNNLAGKVINAYDKLIRTARIRL